MNSGNVNVKNKKNKSFDNLNRYFASLLLDSVYNLNQTYSTITNTEKLIDEKVYKQFNISNSKSNIKDDNLKLINNFNNIIYSEYDKYSIIKFVDCIRIEKSKVSDLMNFKKSFKKELNYNKENYSKKDLGYFTSISVIKSKSIIMYFFIINFF